MTRPLAVLITPVLPLPGGSGRALRAWDWLQELARTHRVHVVLAAVSHLAPELPPDYPAERVWNLAGELAQPGRAPRLLGFALPWLAAQSRRVMAEALLPRPGASVLGQLAAELRAQPPERVVVFRLGAHEVVRALPAPAAGGRIDLDVDDLESATRLSVARALLRMGRPWQALREALIGLQYLAVERWTRADYQTAWLASPEDCARLVTRLAAEVACRPNRMPGLGRLPAPAAGDAFEMLFVGTLDYPPNEEAVGFLLDHVLPHLRQHGVAWHLTIAGRHAPAGLRRRLGACPDATLADSPAELAGFYARAHAVLVPLRFGGGTKLKTLEAYAYGRPVVSTREGVRGLDAVAGRDYLPAETAGQFAAALVRLASDHDLAHALATAGHALWQTRFSPS